MLLGVSVRVGGKVGDRGVVGGRGRWVDRKWCVTRCPSSRGAKRRVGDREGDMNVCVCVGRDRSDEERLAEKEKK